MHSYDTGMKRILNSPFIQEYMNKQRPTKKQIPKNTGKGEKNGPYIRKII